MDAVYGALIAVAVAGCATVETRVKSADRAIDMGNLDSAERQLTEAARKTGGDPREVALIERARRKLRRERLRAQVATIGVTPSEQAFYEIEAFRARVHDAGGDAAMERTLDDAMLRQKRHAVERVEELAGAGSYRSAQSLAVMIAGLPSPLPPDLQQRIRVAMSAATQHHFKLSEEAGAQWPLAQRVHLGLAVAYQGGTLAPATQLAAPYARGVTVRTNGVGCPNAVAIRSALEATGANRAEIDITFSSCHERDDATTASQHATWTQQVYSHTERQPSSRQVCGMERRESSLGAASNDCTVNTWTQPPSLSCKPVTVSYNVEVCRTVTTYIDMPIYKPVQRSGVREITTHTSSVSIAGTAVARLAGREVQKAFNQSARSTDTSYPAIGTLAAKGATHARAKALMPGVQTKVIAEIEAALRELFAPQSRTRSLPRGRSPAAVWRRRRRPGYARSSSAARTRVHSRRATA